MVKREVADGIHRIQHADVNMYLFTPGHTLGHCALHLPERDAVLSGDALVTLDPYAGAATADSPMALASPAAPADTGARSVLPGHGEPRTDGVATAVELAVRTGPH